MNKVPKKNISDSIADIRPSEERKKSGIVSIKTEMAEKFLPQESAAEDYADEEKRYARKIIALSVISIIILAGIFGYVFFRSKMRLLEAAVIKIRKLTPLADFLGSDGANKNQIVSGGNSFQFSGLEDLKNIIPLVKNAGSAYKNFGDLSSQLFILSGEIGKLRTNWSDYFFKHKGGELIDNLKKINESLTLLSETADKAAADSSALAFITPFNSDDYMDMQMKIGNMKNFLNVLIPRLESKTPRHIAVFFGNSSELRPGGGFLGSYADVTVSNGNVENIAVHDISEPDSQLSLSLVPPKPLQSVIKRWRAADSNWFFDFSKSSEKTLKLLEASDMYKSQAFEGTIAVSPKVIKDVLEVTGPIEISKNLTINSSNFLPEIQKDVQTGQAQSLSNPKSILEKLTPLILEKISLLNEEQKSSLAGLLSQWIEKKDLLLYFKDPVFENFADGFGATGKVLELPADFNGDYLAVVNANIGGGKTDLVMKQKVTLESRIDSDGTINNHLAIERTHGGEAKDPWWYRVPNEDHIQIFTPDGSELTGASGGISKKIVPRVKYDKSFSSDADVQNLESAVRQFLNYPQISSFAESGKNIFAVWSETKMGDKSQIAIDYVYKLYTPPVVGETYQFVFEKQAASQGEYIFEISAPVGFRFRENGLPVYEYKTDDPPGRMILNLTFEKSI